MKNKRSYFFISILLACFCFANAQKTDFKKFCAEFIKEYKALEIPATGLDYKNNFGNIQNKEQLEKQQLFFVSQGKILQQVEEKNLNAEEKLRYKQLNYEIVMNLERIALEKNWNDEGRKIPENGLHSLPNYKEWYSYYIKHFTSVNISPEEVFAMGLSEVKKIQSEIKSIQTALGFKDEESFYKYLGNNSFYLKDKDSIQLAYAEIDKTVRKNLEKMFPKNDVVEIGVMEWPDSGPNTPPGIYLGKKDNAYGKDIFQYNFYGHKHNRRSMEWLYMHEAIPGHHLQSVVRRTTKEDVLSGEYFYFGNAEGWACYIEDFGKELGLYQNQYTYLGKWQWDLVRSARLVMEVGIHYYGWSYEKAMEYWKENIKGQDEIAEREIKRITNWAGQALCYKVGALTIKQIVTQKIEQGVDSKTAHQFFLTHSDFPLQVLLAKIS